jgi:hypothetical protein
VVQYLQFRYQQGVLYRLKALGERHNMDITIEGFHSWMWRGLSFLLPFLYAGYLFQLFNAYVLYRISQLPDAPWQVTRLSGGYFVKKKKMYIYLRENLIIIVKETLGCLGKGLWR